MQWHREPEGEERLTLELEKLKRSFPQFDFDFTSDDNLVVFGWLGPSDVLKRAHFIVAEFPYNYGFGSRIKVYAPKENFSVGTPHLYTSQELCLEHDDFTANDDITTVIGWAIEWFALYENYLATGKTWD